MYNPSLTKTACPCILYITELPLDLSTISIILELQGKPESQSIYSVIVSVSYSTIVS